MSHALVFLEATWSKILEGEANQLKERLLSEAPNSEHSNSGADGPSSTVSGGQPQTLSILGRGRR